MRPESRFRWLVESASPKLSIELTRNEWLLIIRALEFQDADFGAGTVYQELAALVTKQLEKAGI